MNLVLIETSAALTVGQLRSMFPDVLFPPDADMSNDMLADYGAAVLEDDPQPSVGVREYLQPGAIRQEDGIWYRGWVVAELQVSSSEVDIERDRRMDGGFAFEGKLIQSRPDDRDNISGAFSLASLALITGTAAGDLLWDGTGNSFGWIAEDNSLIPMGPGVVVAFGKAAALWKSMTLFKARALKNMSPIPLDYTDDKWWVPRGEITAPVEDTSAT